MPDDEPSRDHEPPAEHEPQDDIRMPIPGERERAVADDAAAVVAANQAFHFAMFRLSGLDLVVDEIDRLWRRSEPYRTVHLYDSGGRARVVREHRKMITALRRGDTAALVALMDAHRDHTVADLSAALGLPPRA